MWMKDSYFFESGGLPQWSALNAR
jgi:hypothetical protein